MAQTTLNNRPYHNSNLFSGHYLDERLKQRPEWDCDVEAEAAMEELQSLYSLEEDLVGSYGEDALIDNWIDEVLEILGYGTQVETTLPDGQGYVDVLLFENEESRRDAASVYLDTQDTTDLFERGIGIVEAKQWGANFDTRFSEQRPYRDASHQIKHYLENVEGVDWGILTNGRKWRLYGTKDYETKTYYEVDLPELLETDNLELFKYFYVFFRSEAFRESAGTTFHEAVWSESETAVEQLGEDLQDNVFTALRVLGHGFIESNNLDIGPEDTDELDELKEQSLVLLYRLMFVLYAESRGLIHPEGQAAIEEYEENFSLDQLRLEIHEAIGEVDRGFDSEYSEHSTTMWSRLEDLFRLIDEGKDSLGIPPYNGGLFDREKHTFLSENTVSNRHLAEVIYRLSTTENDEGRYVLADYADLDTRHLGSVYEGLLEHQFQIAPEDYAAVEEEDEQVWNPATEVTVADAIETVPEGGLYVVNDEGERKATGAYYTPDYVVTYIVEESIGPLIEEIRQNLVDQGFEPGTQEYLGPFLKRVTRLKILDPAMGSGHFLTRATEYLANEVMSEVRDVESEMGVAFDEQHVRREIAKECIYGVDINGMAVELAKLSMWLETLAADRPLAFLDHHLKTGDSLLGSDVTDVLSNGEEREDGQLTLQQSLARVRERTLDHVMERMQELLEIDNETLEDIKSMEEIYDDIRSDPFYQRLFELTNVHTASQFDLDVPDAAFEQMAMAIEDEEEWTEIREEDWFKSAQAMAGETTFFHWELEFPEVFFSTDGEKLEDAGFDTVLGNPPYGDILSPTQKQYCRNVNRGFESERADIFTAFVARAQEIVKPGKKVGYILPNTFLRGEQYSDFRITNSEQMRPEAVVDYNDIYVFNVEFYTAIVIFQNSGSEDAYTATYVSGSDYNTGASPVPFEIDPGSDQPWIPENPLANSIRHSNLTVELNDGPCSCHDAGIDYKVRGQGWQDRGEGTKVSDLILYEGEQQHPDDQQYIGGSEITPFQISPEQKWLRHDYESFIEGDVVIQVYPEYNDVDEKIVTRQTAHRQDSIIAAVDQSQLYTAKSVHTTILQDEDYNSWYLTAILNSRIIDYVYDAASGEQGQTFGQVRLHELRGLPIPQIDFDDETGSTAEEYEQLCQEYENVLATDRTSIDVRDCKSRIAVHDCLADVAQDLEQLKSDYANVNAYLPDHLGSYSSGPTLREIEGRELVEGVAETPLTSNTTEFDRLRIQNVEVKEEDDKLVLYTTLRYKPENPEDHDTDHHGYTTTEQLPAFEFTDVGGNLKPLLMDFVPYVVEGEIDDANFLSEARKGITPLDRLQEIVLPDVEEVKERMADYQQKKNQATRLEQRIFAADEFMNQLVYHLYGLSDEEIEAIEAEVMVELRDKIVKGETT